MSSIDLLLKNPIHDPCLPRLYAPDQLAAYPLVILVLPVAGLVMGRVGKSLKRSSLEVQNLSGELVSQIEETLSGLRIIKPLRLRALSDGASSRLMSDYVAQSSLWDVVSSSHIR